ncbi:GNAT family N-acetyltransferase [Hyphococcus lacteus]|uniref:GNAT family N-acetyltransferase n=1 Tax=Hyphococcus lacteus TaxID=3143536 RepID=A0ABV3Z7P6_9PROT
MDMTVETERLRLRVHTLDDFPAIRDLWGNPEVTRFIGGTPRGEEDSWLKFLRMAGHWHLNGYGFWAVEERQSGRIIGELGFADFKRNMTPTPSIVPEMGWAFDPEFQGKGYAIEAAKAAIEWGEAKWPGERMSCIITAENKPSVRLAEKIGFIRSAATEYHGDEVFLLFREPSA